MAKPAYTRLDVEERRRRLLELGTELFTRHSYDELSMAAIARHAGISKALLYHYFPSKKDFFVATLQQAADDLRRTTEPREDRPPLEQLTASVDAYLEWIEAHSPGYAKLMQSATSVAEVRELIEAVRDETSTRIIAGIAGEHPPAAVRTAVRAWLWFMDGACLDWVEHRDLERWQLRDLLLGTLLGAVSAAGSSAGTVGRAPG